MYAYYFIGNVRGEALYRDLLEGLQGLRPEIPARGDPRQINRALLAILIDHPGLFWFEGGWTPLGAGQIEAIRPRYTLDPARIRQGEAALAECLRALSPAKRLPGPERALYLYRWLIGHVAYGLGDARGQSLYDALVTGRAVCKGLSKAYQYLANALGLFCTLSKGTLDGQSPHVWNILELEGGYCNVDVSMGYGEFSHLYAPPDRDDPLRAFGVPDARLQRTHQILDYGFPRLTCNLDLRRMES